MKRTPIWQAHVALAAKTVDFNGWEMPLNYGGGILAEHLATRKYGGLFDISHMGRFVIGGGDALPFLQYVLTGNAAALKPGQSHYTLIANEAGGAIDDTFLYRTTEDEYLLVVNAGNAGIAWEWLQDHRRRFAQVRIEDRTADIAMLAFQGPRSSDVLGKVLGDTRRLPPPRRNRMRVVELLGASVPIARTGYTGEPVGFELFPPADKAIDLWNTLLEVGEPDGIVPVGLGARDTLRLEAGFPLHGHELGIDAEGEDIPAFALPVARIAVSFAAPKGVFIGREALLRQFEEYELRRRGLPCHPGEECVVPRTIRPMAIPDGTIARAGYPVYTEERHAGRVTSGTMVPYWKTEGEGVGSRPGHESGRRAICLAYVDADLPLGMTAKVEVRTRIAEAVVVGKHLDSATAPYARPLVIDQEPPARVSTRKPPQSLGQLSGRLVEKARANTLWRQQDAVNLIPSETTPSTLVRLLTIADPAGRYAEHRRLKSLAGADVYYYEGTEFIADVEQTLVAELKKFIGCSEVEIRVISGQMANAAVFSGIVHYLNRDRSDKNFEPRRLRSVMNHLLGAGGHLSSQPMGALRDYVSIDPLTERWAVVNFPISADYGYRIDIERAADLVDRHKPELLILGKSMILHPEPVKELAQIIERVQPKPILMYDAAHVLGLLGPDFQDPLAEGADLVTASTHKTFFGTQRGLIASNMGKDSRYASLWRSIVTRVFPGSVSNHHLGTLLGLLMATHEMNEYGRDYARQVMANAKAFALALKEERLGVEGDPAVKHTETHQVILRVGYARGAEIADRLEKSNIVVNYQALPDDEAFTSSSGIRMGVQEMTRFGMKEEDFGELAGYVADVILREKDVSLEVSRFRKHFTRMEFCLPEEQARPLVDELLGSLV